jgi:hypothetical protein
LNSASAARRTHLSRKWILGYGSLTPAAGKKRVVGVNLTYYNLGGAPLSTTIPLVGTLSGEYSTNYAIGLDLTLRWIH